MLDTKGHKICAGYKHAAVKKYVSEKLLLSVYRYVSNAEYFGSVGTYSFNFHWQNLDFHFRGYKSLLCTLGVGTWQLEYFLSLVSSFVKKKGKKKTSEVPFHITKRCTLFSRSTKCCHRTAHAFDGKGVRFNSAKTTAISEDRTGVTAYV